MTRQIMWTHPVTGEELPVLVRVGPDEVHILDCWDPLTGDVRADAIALIEELYHDQLAALARQGDCRPDESDHA